MNGKDVIKVFENAGYDPDGIDEDVNYAPMSYGEFRRLWRKFKAWCRRVEPGALDDGMELAAFVVRHRRPVQGETPILEDGANVLFVSPDGGGLLITVNAATGWVPEVNEQENSEAGAEYAECGEEQKSADCSDAVPAGA
jgi:hypothetical protein